MNKQVKLACRPEVETIAIEKILPMRKVSQSTRGTSKYRRIATSIGEVGIIEPLVVHPNDEAESQFMLLDGHLRLDILVELGATEVECLIATDDEAFTYNHKINRLSVIQEHFMIMEAIKNGVSEDEIARTLNVDVANIRKKQNMLTGICREAVEILKGKQATAGTLRELRRVKPMRQIEMAELMCASHNFSVGYAKCLTISTPDDQLVEPETTKDAEGLTPADIARMEHEMESLGRDFKQIEETYGKNVLNLVVATGYLKTLLENARVVRYLAGTYPEILSQFQQIADSRSLAEPTTAE